MDPILNYINGEYVKPSSNDYIDVIDPAIGEKYTVVANSNKNDIDKIYGLLKSGNIAFKEDYDILEGKYHQLRSELDCVYKVLEMDALDIQDLYEQLENHPKKGENNASK